MKALRIFSTLMLACGIALIAQAEIYKTVDENGNVVFTDNPKGNKAEEIKLPEVNTQPATRITVKLSPPKEEETDKDKKPEKYTITLESPANETTVTMGQLTLTSSVAISPALAEEHSVQFYIDGKPSGKPSQATSHTFGQLYRGAHKIHAAILNKKGKVLKKTKAVTIYVHRAKAGANILPVPYIGSP
ncbi:MAG: DUF4124 domain-containing protein [Candidatus Pelagadaptatus aseana]|uniref:DUF4124 domain-containing protein n=1 Tax=Candidatus Pelagadaptatus aseana TaxID=3120508 RepID=UPI0039B2ED10